MNSTQNSEAKAKKKKALHVAIVGGGFAGLCFAFGLQRHQISYQIYEASSTFSVIGAGITFTPNGVNAMRLTHPEIPRELLKHATLNGYGSQREGRLNRRSEAHIPCRRSCVSYVSHRPCKLAAFGGHSLRQTTGRYKTKRSRENAVLC